MAVSVSTTQLTGLAKRFIDENIVAENIITAALAKARQNKKTLVQHMIDAKLAPSRSIAAVVSKEYGVPFIDIAEYNPDVLLTGAVDAKILEKYSVVPLIKKGKKLVIASSDPSNTQAVDDIRFATGLQVEIVVSEREKIEAALGGMGGGSSSGLEVGEDDFENETLDKIDTVSEATQSVEDEESGGAPIIRFVNKMLVDAIRRGASDLHFEPYEKNYRIRFRVDGELINIKKLPVSSSQKISARIKVMSRLDISERRVPQDGRIKLKISNTKTIDFRVSTCPTLFGEKCVLRILDSDSASLQIDQLGYEDHQKKLFLANLKKPYGMFLVTGPTGSGKTVSLYTGINILNTPEVNISTAEDPVEINLNGINQVQVDERTGMTFPKALKAFLRQDPDIILVGEIRDLETASIAVKAAQTGHMVMSTLHTNDGPQTLTRMKDMGIPSFAVATSINLITAQRLCKRLHVENREVADIPKATLLKEGFPKELVEKGFRVYEPKADADLKYKGRAGIYQVMPISDDMRRLIITEANSVQLADQAAKEGIWDLRRSGLQKVISGITSLSEINRVTME